MYRHRFCIHIHPLLRPAAHYVVHLLAREAGPAAATNSLWPSGPYFPPELNKRPSLIGK